MDSRRTLPHQHCTRLGGEGNGIHPYDGNNIFRNIFKLLHVDSEVRELVLEGLLNDILGALSDGIDTPEIT